MSNPITVTVSESNVGAGGSVTVTVLNAAPSSGAGKTIVSSGGIANLTTQQQAEVSQGVIVVTTDGYRYVYSGTGSKTNPASYVALADITPDWSALSGKPSTFAPSSHASVHGAAGDDPVTVAISQVTGLQTGLDGKVSSAVEWTVNHTTLDGTRYMVGDLVYSGGNVYRCIAENESLPVTATEYWALVGAGYRLNIDGRDIPNLPDELPASATDGDVLTYSSGSWIASASSGGGSLPAGTEGHVLTYSSGAWASQAPVAELPGSATSGDVLTYSGGSWVAAAPSGGGSLPSGSQGQFLKYDGTNWIAASLTSTASAGQFLQYDGSNWVAAAFTISDYSASVGYSVGDLVAHQNTIWRATNTGMGNEPQTGGSYWVNVSGVDEAELPTASSTGDVVTWNGSAWVAQQPSGIVSNTGAVHPGASQITNIVSLSQSDYDTLAPKSSTTLYIITG